MSSCGAETHQLFSGHWTIDASDTSARAAPGVHVGQPAPKAASKVSHEASAGEAVFFVFPKTRLQYGPNFTFSYTPPATAVLFDGRNAHLEQRRATAGSSATTKLRTAWSARLLSPRSRSSRHGGRQHLSATSARSSRTTRRLSGKSKEDAAARLRRRAPPSCCSS